MAHFPKYQMIHFKVNHFIESNIICYYSHDPKQNLNRIFTYFLVLSVSDIYMCGVCVCMCDHMDYVLCI